MGIRNLKRRGAIFITYEYLANLLGLQSNSIRAIELDPLQERFYIIHDDSNFAKDIAENDIVPISNVNPLKTS